MPKLYYFQFLTTKDIMPIMLVLDKSEPAIRRAIKLVAIGKKGSKPLLADLINELIKDYREGRISPVCQGAFFGALIIKGVTAEEKALDSIFQPGTLENPARLIESLSPECSNFVKQSCVELLEGKTLSKETSYRLGQFLFETSAGEPGFAKGDAARGLIASVLRVRYETIDEYEGIWQSMQETFESSFRLPAPVGPPIVQLAEPFDGVDQSNMITPLVADSLQSLGYRVVSQVGRSSGPKFGNNLLSIAQKIHGLFLKSNTEFSGARRFGWYMNQEDLSKPIDHWADLRRQIIKRPFLATLERFVNPLNADILIASAFHPPYGEKMVSVAERAGFPGVVIVRNGIEGTMAFALKRAVKILCSSKQRDGTYLRHEFEFQAEQYLGRTFEIEENLDQPSLDANAALIETFATQGKTANPLFDGRVKATCEGLKIAAQWIENNGIKFRN